MGIANLATSSHDYSLGVLAQKDIGKTTHRANLMIKRDFGDTAVAGTNFIYRWMSKYNYTSAFQPGFEVLGDTKKKDAFRDQSLRIGPAAYGSFDIGDNQKIGYDLGYMIGITSATEDGELKWKLKYSTEF